MVNCACILSAFCFIVSNALRIAVIVERQAKGGGRRFWRLMKLDTDAIQSAWEHRRGMAPLEETGHIFNLFAWLFFLIPVITLAWTLSKGGKRLVSIHAAIAGFAIIGCMTEVISRLLYYGAWGSANFMAKRFALTGWTDDGSDAIGWKVLEVIWTVCRGLIFWIDTFEWFCLFFIMCLLYVSMGSERKDERRLSIGLGRLGLAIAFLCFFDTVMSILRIEDWRHFARFVDVVSIFNTCILLPLWLVWLGCSIHNTYPSTNNSAGNIEDPVWSAGVSPSVEMAP